MSGRAVLGGRLRYFERMTLDHGAAAALARTIADPVRVAAGADLFFHPITLAAGETHGLDGLGFYFAGRGGWLGDVESDVVASAFGWFHPDLVARRWAEATAALSPHESGRRYWECVADVGRATLSTPDGLGVPGLDAWCDAAEQAVAAARRDGLVLFAAVGARPLADDPPARALQLATQLRELRGSAHLIAVVASGQVPAVVHAVHRPEMIEVFGWPADLDTSSFDHSAREVAESRTDRLVGAAFETLDSAQAEALEATAPALAEAVRASRRQAARPQ